MIRVTETRRDGLRDASCGLGDAGYEIMMQDSKLLIRSQFLRRIATGNRKMKWDLFGGMMIGD